MSNKEQVFFSAIIYLDEVPCVEELKRLNDVLHEKYAHYELVCVDDCSDKEKSAAIRGVIEQLDNATVCIVVMGKRQGLEASMNAGIDAAVGDYLLEVDDLASFDEGFIERAHASLASGNDIVNGVPAGASTRGKLFYPLFNRFSGSQYKLTTNTCRMVSRRAVNRVHAMSEFMPYRKAAYAASGLAMDSIPVGNKGASLPKTGMGTAIDSIALYTDFFYKASVGIAAAMSLLSLAEFVYTIIILCTQGAVEGWATMMLVLSVGFCGLFVILTFVLKYLSLLLQSDFNNQDYLVEGIQKIELT